MNEKQLSKSVIKKIQMSKLLYDLAVDCFRVSENTEKIGAGLILLQDSVELFLIAIYEHLEPNPKKQLAFDKYFVEIEGVTKESTPLKKQMLILNAQRVNIKHHGVLPNIYECKDFPNTVNNFFQELSNRYLEVDFDSITLVDLLNDDEIKALLKQSEDYLKAGNYKECMIDCRKALYFTFEKRFDIRVFENGNTISPVMVALASDAPYYARSKEYIDKNVKEPTDYILIDHDKLEKDLLLIGVIPRDFWNIWRITPSLYYYEEDDEWIIKDEFCDEVYNEENAEYCFRKTVEILLLKQRAEAQSRYVKTKGVLITTKNKKVKVFKKASLQSGVTIEIDGPFDFFSRYRVRGLYDKKFYHNVISVNGNIKEKTYIFGYICEDDIDLKKISEADQKIGNMIGK